jgi:hypothetical protein
MKRTVLLASVVLALAGCSHKEADTSSSTPPPPATGTASGNSSEANAPEAPPPGGPVDIPQDQTANAGADKNTTATGAPDLNAITMQLRGWMMSQRTGPPKSFEEWIARSHIQVPPPPPGKKYAIRHVWVVLVDK